MRRTLLLVLVATAVLLAACGDDDATAGDGPSALAGDSTPATTAGGADAGAVVSTASTDLGDVLVNAGGMTIYGFTNDVDGTPTCEDTCAEAWPAVVVDSEDLPAGLDSGIFSVVERADGRYQLKAGDWPLYTFASDIVPGDTNGQGVGGVWFAVGPNGDLLSADATSESAPAVAGY